MYKIKFAFLLLIVHISILSLLEERQNQGFPAVVDSDSINEWGTVWEARVRPEVLPGLQRTLAPPDGKWLLDSYYLFITCGPLVDHGESISAVKFLLRVHIK